MSDMKDTEAIEVSRKYVLTVKLIDGNEFHYTEPVMLTDTELYDYIDKLEDLMVSKGCIHYTRVHYGKYIVITPVDKIQYLSIKLPEEEEEGSI